MKKSIFMMMAVAGMLVFAACGSKTANNAEGTDSTATAENAEATAQNEVKEGSKGPCTVSCDKFSIDIPEGWQVFAIKETAGVYEIGVGIEYHEHLNFQYQDQANYAQERQIKMEKNGMQDLGEKTYGENTYATYMWKIGDDEDFNAILKIGDGSAGVINVTSSHVNTPDNEAVLKVLGSLKMK